MRAQVTTGPKEILLVDDSQSDVRLMIQAMQEAGLAAHVTVARDGVEALALLTGRGADGPYRPDLLILDLNMPRKDGREVLRDVKADPQLRNIPVLVLTTS